MTGMRRRLMRLQEGMKREIRGATRASWRRTPPARNIARGAPRPACTSTAPCWRRKLRLGYVRNGYIRHGASMPASDPDRLLPLTPVVLHIMLALADE